MRCEHEWLEREPGREEPNESVNDGFREYVCARCDNYRVVNTKGVDMQAVNLTERK